MIKLSLRAVLDVSAASGLVVHTGGLCVVADDETFLACYGMDGSARSRIPLLADVLPADHAERKRRKPDLEALTALPDGRLLAMGSGSTAARRRGALVDLRSGQVQAVDLSALYLQLEQEFPELNIEGAAIAQDRLWLGQRGNGRAGQHALIALDLPSLITTLHGTARIEAASLVATHAVELGELAGVQLGMTDLAAHPDGGLLFCAAAEASDSTYLDGECVGAAIGRVSFAGDVLTCEPVDLRCKLEGLAVAGCRTRELDLWLVADADDPSRRAPLLHATIPR